CKIASLHFPEDTRAWELLPTASKMWAAWQICYPAADIAPNCLLKLNPLPFGAANHVTNTITDMLLSQWHSITSPICHQ
ncbi:MAG: hypothetical protein ACK55Z_25235, partial [bacterium]